LHRYPPTKTSFSSAIWSFDATGIVTQTPRAANSMSPRIWPTCVFNGASWDCTCPSTPPPILSHPWAQGPFPAFRVWPATPEPSTAAAPPANAASSPWGGDQPGRAGFVLLNSVGCTRLPGAADTCLDFIARGEIGEGISFQRTTLALRSGLAVAPAAAITARDTVTAGRLAGTAPQGGEHRLPKWRLHGQHDQCRLDKTLFDVQTIPGTPPDLSFVDTDAQAWPRSAAAPASAASGSRFAVSGRTHVRRASSA
jgi:hypothetical protein